MRSHESGTFVQGAQVESMHSQSLEELGALLLPVGSASDESADEHADENAPEDEPDRTFIDRPMPYRETLREPEAYGLLYSAEVGFEVQPYDRHGRPIHHHPLGARAYETPADAYAAIRAFEAQRDAA